MHRSIDDFYIPPPRTYHGRGKPPAWLLAVLGICLILLVVFLSTRFSGEGAQSAGETLSPSHFPSLSTSPVLPSVSALPTPVATPERFISLEPSATPGPAASPASVSAEGMFVPQGQSMPKSWFSDAVFVGDSRTDGFKMYSGVCDADYLDYTGLTIYDVADDKPVIRSNADKISILEALSQKKYGKIYICLGVNELGYGSSDQFGKVYGEVIDRIRTLQPDATLYAQTIVPVNKEKCAEYNQLSYVTNEAIQEYNVALIRTAIEKQVFLLNVAEVLIDGTGELRADVSSDGVHFKKEGYEIWRDYLLCHTGQ